MDRLQPFHLDHLQLEELARQYRVDYRQAKPFPHFVYDDFLPDAVLDRVINEFPKPSEVTWTVDHDDAYSKKLGLMDETRIGNHTRHLLSELNSAGFLTFLEALTGIDGLIPDPYFRGGGLHQIERGGFLGVHVDFNRHKKFRLDRRINLIIFLNRDWEEDYGGHLELWNKDVTKCEKKILPIFNRCAIFNTSDISFHGHPDPLTCPKGHTRKSIALYYYTNGRPEVESSDPHSTIFRRRPTESGGVTPTFKVTIRKFIPPILADWVSRIKRRMTY